MSRQDPPALANLRANQTQADADGTLVTVSHEALDETFAYIDGLHDQVRRATGVSDAMRRTHTFSTVAIVIIDGDVYAEDLSAEPDAIAQEVANPRVFTLISRDHFRRFVDHDGRNSMGHFTRWLREIDAVVSECWILGETLSDAERQA